MEETFPAPLVCVSAGGPGGGGQPPLHMRWALVLSVLSAVLLLLAFPYTRVYPLTLVALVPFLMALRGQGARRGVLLGAVHGCIVQGCLMFWSNFFGPPAFLFLALYKALLPTVFGGLVGWLAARRPQLLPAGFLTGWVALEYLQTFGPFGVTWGMLSHAWARHPLPIQISALLGPWALSAALLLVNISVFVLLQSAWKEQRKAWLSLTAAAWLFTMAFGSWRLGQEWPRDQTIRLGAVQVNMGRDVKWDPNYARFALDRLLQMTRDAAGQGAQVIVWPETAVPFRGFLADPRLTYEIALLAREVQAWLVVGSIERVANDPQRHTLNAASLVSPEGEYKARYDKQRLVPGGEYLPLSAYLRDYKIFDRVMRYLPGTGDGLFDCPDNKARGGMLICFESMVPYLAAERVAGGANFLIVATNDGWFASNPAIQHHFEMAIMRAVEQGKPVVQCGNTGVSGVIDGRGIVRAETRINEAAVTVAEVGLEDGFTLYQRLGDVLAHLCLALFVISLLGAKGSTTATGKL